MTNTNEAYDDGFLADGEQTREVVGKFPENKDALTKKLPDGIATVEKLMTERDARHGWPHNNAGMHFGG